ncbi:ArnT family glycosyltransferase [Gordonia amicalis]|uniref:ArnT family glycosyltransferase n=1 Tax=Gordonia amicalis TaxID=89053 RepID=UPI0002A644C6|nr:glycosyltransferase family 39 protein [Gordonia amicalis]NKX77738.1 glycosyltransferase family 39 protein [Gordonia amicalis]GAC52790.1 putative glycosyltransferase [Gordonia amicalis NBRC 100051 = JCM 11271]
MTTSTIDARVTSPAPEPASPPARTVLRERLSLAALLIGTGVLYLWNLSINGWANSFYSAAIQAGSESWKAWFFGSSDMANSITVDKPPASLWIPGLSARLFGVNSWSILVPEALMGVASVALLYLITRKYFGHRAGILAGGVLATTPVAALMFRFDNPEALLILLMIAAVWSLMKAVDDGRWRWLILTGVLVGFGFLTKQLQVTLIVPALSVTYLAFGPGGWPRRLGQLFAALGAMIVSAGWWILAVELWPASSRPYIGGSQNNSILELTLGYNGLGRLNGDETGAVVPGRGHGMGALEGMGGPGGGRGGAWGETGWLRMFEPAQGGQIAWLIPAGLVLAIVALVLIGKARRTDPRRAYLSVWGLWLLVTMGVFSFMAGIFHQYYTAALAPAVAAVVAAGGAVCWSHRDRLWVRLALGASVAITAIWGFVLLDRTPDFVPWLRYAVLIVGLLAAVAMVFARIRVVAAAALSGAVIAGLAGPVAYTVDTVTAEKSGSIITAGPAVAGGFGPGGRGGPGMPGGRGGDGPGGLLRGSTPTQAVVDKLIADADDYTWVAAAVGSQSASGYQLETGHSVMPIGGFNGSDPSPTLAEFQKLVAAREIHYFIGGGGPGAGAPGMAGGSSQPSSQISTWVQDNFTPVTVDGTTMYDLTQPTS